MPSPSPHALIWSEVQQYYELSTHGQPEQCFRRGDEPAWQSWLAEHTAFAFVGQAGWLSVLKEARSRGAGYWYAYRTQDRHTRKHYLEPTVKVTFDRLEEAAKVLKSEPPSAPLRTPRQKETSSSSRAETGREESRPNAKPWAERGGMLLSPKLSRPRLSTLLVERERLLSELDAVRSHPLTLISASAGSGKTTLLSAWGALSSQQQESLETTEGVERTGAKPTLRSPGFPLMNWIIIRYAFGPRSLRHYETACVSGFQAAFSGSHRYVLDYLSDEVLARQPTAVQQFLLHTCILDRLNEPLCDVVTGQEGSQAMLEALEWANLFVVALDDERHWYRYHHLFAQVLRRHLQQAEPKLLPVLYRRASAWYEQHDLPIEAVQHALAAPDVALTARLIEPIAVPVALHGQIDTVLGWMNALPEAMVRTCPFLSVYYALLLIFTNQLEAAEARLQEAERSVQEEMPAEQTQTIQGWVLGNRAAIAALSGEITHVVSPARQSLDLLPEAEVFPCRGTIVVTSMAYLVSGDVMLATEHEVAAAMVLIRPSDNPVAVVGSICLLALLYVLQGRLRQAAATYAQVVQAVPRPEMLQTAFSSLFYYFGLGDLLREWNDLDAAERHLAQGMALVKETLMVEPFVAVLGYTALARLQQARGNAHEALETLAHLAQQRLFAP